MWDRKVLYSQSFHMKLHVRHPSSCPVEIWHWWRCWWRACDKGGGEAALGELQWGSAQTGDRLVWWGWAKEGWMGVGVGSMCPEWLKGLRWLIWVMWLAKPGGPPKCEDLSCMHFESSSKPSPARLLLLDLLDILRLRVWIPSFFMVRGLLT